MAAILTSDICNITTYEEFNVRKFVTLKLPLHSQQLPLIKLRSWSPLSYKMIGVLSE